MMYITVTPYWVLEMKLYEVAEVKNSGKFQY